MQEPFIAFLVPNPSGAFWIGLLVTFVVAGDFERPWSRRNLVLALLLLVAAFLVDVMRWEDSSSRWASLNFSAIYLGTALYAGWGFYLSRRPSGVEWSFNLPNSGLRLLLFLALALNTITVFGRPPDDAGYYTNLGARRLVETGALPYGDPKLKGPDAPGYGAAATYGPLLYLSHIPTQYLVGTKSNPADADPREPSYQRPSILATQLTTWLFHLAGLAALFAIVRRSGSIERAYGATVIYAASPYLVGLGGPDLVIGGLRFVSHIAPSAVTLLAFAAIGRPLLAGALLAAAVGILFYPLFLLPAWVGWHIWQRQRPLAFVAGFAGMAALIALMVVWLTPVAEGSSVLSQFLGSTLEHQEGAGAREYGASTFGFWGSHPNLAAFWQTPISGDTSLLKPTFILYASLSAACFFFTRGRSLIQLAGITAGLAAAVQLWKTHAAGSYVEWYLPFLIIALFAGQAAAKAPADD